VAESPQVRPGPSKKRHFHGGSITSATANESYSDDVLAATGSSSWLGRNYMTYRLHDETVRAGFTDIADQNAI